MNESKKEPLTSVNIHSAPKLIRVIAPANLPGGYEMEVQTDDEQPVTFLAKVPREGVNAGDVFLTPPPPGYTADYPQIEAPTGRWKDGLCDCCSYGLCHAQTWLAFCCTEIARGQIMHRFRLTWLGDLLESHTPVTTFKTVLTIVLSYFVFDVSLGLYLDSQSYNIGNQNYYNDDNPLVSTLVWMRSIVSFTFTVWGIYTLYKTRKYVRETYSIPEQNCYGCEDCLCATFCAPLTVAQIARHTGEYEKYPSLCCSETGLPDHAPEVV